MKIFIKFKADIPTEQYEALCQSVEGVSIIKVLKNVPGLITASVETDAQFDVLSVAPFVEYVEKDSQVSLCAEGSLGYGATMIKAPEAWVHEAGDGSVIVAVIDSGIDINHEDLVDQLWVDSHGDFTKGGWDFYDDDNDPSDGYGHGTAMSGIIGATGNNGVGISGVCQNAKLMALKCTPDGSGTFDLTAVVSAIDFALDYGAKIANMSWGGSGVYSQANYDAISAAGDRGMLCVCAAGNGGTNNDTTPFYPASYDLDNIISVMAVNEFWFPANIGNDGFNTAYGHTSVDVAAPCQAYTTKEDGAYQTPPSGTSQAAAYVSGIAALVWSANPDLNFIDVKRIILETATTMMAPTAGYEPARSENLCVTDGIANAEAAVLMALAELSHSAPLTEEVSGRSVQITKLLRDDGKYDVEVEAKFQKTQSAESQNYGSFSEIVKVERFTGAKTLPTEADLAPLYDAPDGAEPYGMGDAEHVPGNSNWGDPDGAPDDPVVYGLWVIEKILTGPEGSGVFRLNELGTYDYAIVWKKTCVVDAEWHVASGPNSDPQRIERKVSTAPQQIRRRIGGELSYREDDDGNLSGVDWNTNFDLFGENGGREYGDIDAPTAWESMGYKRMYGEWDADWEKSLIVNGVGIAGTTYKGIKAHLSDVAVLTEGDIWFVRETGKFHGLAVVRTSYANSEYPLYVGMAYKKMSDGKIYVANNVYTGSTKNFTVTDYWTEVAGVLPMSAFEGIDPVDLEESVRDAYEDTTATSKVPYYIGVKFHQTSDDIYYVCTATSVNAENFIGTVYWAEVDARFIRAGLPAKIGIRGVGVYPQESPDLYIPILQELERELQWDNAFDLDVPFDASGTATAHDLATDEVYYRTDTNTAWKALQQTGAETMAEGAYWTELTSNGGRVYGATNAPSAWASKGYDTIYGEWLAGWEKTLVVGATGVAGHTYRGAKANASDTAAIADGDVWYAKDTGKFYGLIVVRTSYANSEYPLYVGMAYKKMSDGKIYVANNVYTGSEKGFTDTDYWTEVTGALALNEFEAIDPADIAFCIRDAYEDTTETSKVPYYIGGKFHQTGDDKYYISVAVSEYAEDYTNAAYWREVDVDLLKTGLVGYIGMSGIGTYPEEERTKVGVLDSGGAFALSSSARVSFYTNLAENPRWLDIYEALIQDVESIVFRTYFAFNPHWLPEANRRVFVKSTTWTGDAGKKAFAYSLTNGYFTIPYATDNKNFAIKPRFLEQRDGTWVCDLEIELRGEMKADTTKLQERIDALGPYSTGAITGCKAMIYTDLTNLLQTPWVGSYKAVD